MNKNKININLDVNLNQIKSIVLKQYNQYSQWIVVEVIENGKPFYIEEDDICIFKMKTPDGREIYNDCIHKNNIIIVEITKNCCTDTGTGLAELNIINKDTNSQIATFNFNLVIEKSVFDNSDIEGSSEFGSLIERIIEADKAIENANNAVKDLQDKLDSHHFILTEDKDIAGGVPSLDENTKIPISELYEATVTDKGITQLTDSVSSNSVTTAATPNSVKIAYDAAIDERNRAVIIENNLEANKANIANPKFTGTPEAPTAPTGNNTTQIATTAFVQNAVGNGIAASDAMIIKGTIGTTGTVSELPTSYKTGWTYRVVTSGTYAGEICEIGDLIIALIDRDGSENVNSDWCVAQTNINGAITGIKSGDAYISYSQSGSVVTITHKDVTRTNTTSAFTPSHGEGFTAVKSITSDSKGHITSVDTETITLPNGYVHPNTSGNKHIPIGGSSGQVLTWKSDGEAEWDDVPLSQEDTKNNIVTFDSNDSFNATWENVNILNSGEKHSSIFNKISSMFKNVRWLYLRLRNTESLMGAKETLGATNITYTYPKISGGVMVKGGVDSLTTALEESTRNISETVDALNTDLHNIHIGISTGATNSEGAGNIDYPNGFSISNAHILSVKMRFTDNEYYVFPFVNTVDGNVYTYFQYGRDSIFFNFGKKFANTVLEVVLAKFGV